MSLGVYVYMRNSEVGITLIYQNKILLAWRWYSMIKIGSVGKNRRAVFAAFSSRSKEGIAI